jgi:hypothetical protein
LEIQCKNLQDENSSQTIKNIMEAPFHLSTAESETWSAALKLIWEEKLKPQYLFSAFYKSLDSAFQNLKFLNSKIEAQLVMWYVYGFFTGVIHENENREDVLANLRSKYGLS